MKAVIFDLDGVLVSTDTIHKQSLVEAVSLVTGIYSESIVSCKSLSSTREKLELIRNRYWFTDITFNRVLQLKDQIFSEKIINITVMDNVLSSLEFLKEKNIPLAVASNSRLVNIVNTLDSAKIKTFFNVIVSAEEVPHRKPAPDVLFLTYKRLGLANNEYNDTIFIEDSDEGEEAGNRSPSSVIRVNSPNDLTVELLKRYIK